MKALAHQATIHAGLTELCPCLKRGKLHTHEAHDGRRKRKPVGRINHRVADLPLPVRACEQRTPLTLIALSLIRIRGLPYGFDRFTRLSISIKCPRQSATGKAECCPPVVGVTIGYRKRTTSRLDTAKMEAEQVQGALVEVERALQALFGGSRRREETEAAHRFLQVRD